MTNIIFKSVGTTLLNKCAHMRVTWCNIDYSKDFFPQDHKSIERNRIMYREKD